MYNSPREVEAGGLGICNHAVLQAEPQSQKVLAGYGSNHS